MTDSCGIVRYRLARPLLAQTEPASPGWHLGRATSLLHVGIPLWLEAVSSRRQPDATIAPFSSEMEAGVPRYSPPLPSPSFAQRHELASQPRKGAGGSAALSVACPAICQTKDEVFRIMGLTRYFLKPGIRGIAGSYHMTNGHRRWIEGRKPPKTYDRTFRGPPLHSSMASMWDAGVRSNLQSS